MKKIKGYRETKDSFLHIIIPKEENKIEETEKSMELQEENIQEIKQESQNCFALVVVRKIPWYKKLARSIRNFIVIYRWRKAR